LAGRGTPGGHLQAVALASRPVISVTEDLDDAVGTPPLDLLEPDDVSTIRDLLPDLPEPIVDQTGWPFVAVGERVPRPHAELGDGVVGRDGLTAVVGPDHPPSRAQASDHERDDRDQHQSGTATRAHQVTDRSPNGGQVTGSVRAVTTIGAAPSIG
jgi:hypothetical protein